MAALCHSLPPSSHSLLLWVSVSSFPVSYEDNLSLDLGPTLIQAALTQDLSHNCKGPSGGHILGFAVCHQPTLPPCPRL